MTRHTECLRWFILAGVALFPATALIVPNAGSTIFFLLVLAGFAVALRPAWRPALTRDERLVLAVFCLFVAVSLLTFLAGEWTAIGERKLGRHGRLLLIVPLFYAFKYARPDPGIVWPAVWAGALALGGWAIFEYAVLAPPDGRVKGSSLAIMYGNYALLVGAVLLAGASWWQARLGRWAWPVLGGGALAALAGMVLSGTRGAWLALAAVGLVFAWHLVRRRGWHAAVLAAVALVLVVGVSLAWSSLGVAERFAQVWQETQRYFSAQAAAQAASGPQSAWPRCFDGREALDNLRASLQLPPDVKVEVVADAVRLREAPERCQAGYALRFTNTAAHRSAAIHLPRQTLPGVTSQSARLLVRGRAEVRFADRPVVRVAAARDYQTLSFENAAAAGEGRPVEFWLPPRGRFWIVPIELAPGEYGFAHTYGAVAGRLEMWRAAWQVFLERPWLGVGTGAFQQAVIRLAARGEVAPFIAGFDHAHNEYLTALAARGLAGLAALGLLYFLPGLVFWRAARDPHAGRRAAGMAGFVTVIAYACFGLTEAFLDHSITTTCLAFYVALFLAMMAGTARSDSTDRA
ncbi:MAG TPA: O-antigen ligase family protein [Gammaproteobacteria bacterium]|nr:O-antigen ligase family protein [Gammaproteobacteria bacterium]